MPKNARRAKVFVGAFVGLTFLVFGFQNCGSGFQALSPLQTSTAGSSGESDPQPSAGSTPPATVEIQKSEIPFIQLNLQGGAALSANLVVLDKNGAYLPSYSRLGLGSLQELQPHIVEAFGARWDDQSGILRGIRSALEVNDDPRISVFGIATRSADNTDLNKLSLAAIIQRSGLEGSLIRALGNTTSPTGIGQASAFIEAVPTTTIRSTDDIAALIQVSRNPAFAWNPFLSPIAATWNLTPTTSPSSRDAVYGAMVYNSLIGSAGPIGISMGGFDYRNGTRTTGTAVDESAGAVIGRILKSATILSKPVFIFVSTDGGMCALFNETSYGAAFGADCGTRSLQLMFVFDPSSRYQRVSANYMIGAFDPATQASDPSLVPEVAEKAAGLVAANYLALNGWKVEQIQQLMPVFTSDEIRDYIRIQKKSEP